MTEPVTGDKLTTHETPARSMKRKFVFKERAGHLYLFQVAGTPILYPIRIPDFWGTCKEKP